MPLEDSSFSGRTRRTSLEPNCPRKHKIDKGIQSTDRPRSIKIFLLIRENVLKRNAFASLVLLSDVDTMSLVKV